MAASPQHQPGQRSVLTAERTRCIDCLPVELILLTVHGANLADQSDTQPHEQERYLMRPICPRLLLDRPTGDAEVFPIHVDGQVSIADPDRRTTQGAGA